MKDYSKCITKPIAKLYIEEEKEGVGDDVLLCNLQNRIIRAFSRTSTEVQDFLQFIKICLDLNDMMIGIELGDYPPNVDLELGYRFYMHWLYNLCERKIKEE
jgi:hypothetical protein